MCGKDVDAVGVASASEGFMVGAQAWGRDCCCLEMAPAVIERFVQVAFYELYRYETAATVWRLRQLRRMYARRRLAAGGARPGGGIVLVRGWARGLAVGGRSSS